jgi:hypothetical protein
LEEDIKFISIKIFTYITFAIELIFLAFSIHYSALIIDEYINTTIPTILIESFSIGLIGKCILDYNDYKKKKAVKSAIEASLAAILLRFTHNNKKMPKLDLVKMDLLVTDVINKMKKAKNDDYYELYFVLKNDINGINSFISSAIIIDDQHAFALDVVVSNANALLANFKYLDKNIFPIRHNPNINMYKPLTDNYIETFAKSCKVFSNIKIEEYE